MSSETIVILELPIAHPLPAVGLVLVPLEHHQPSLSCQCGFLLHGHLALMSKVRISGPTPRKSLFDERYAVRSSSSPFNLWVHFILRAGFLASKFDCERHTSVWWLRPRDHVPRFSPFLDSGHPTMAKFRRQRLTFLASRMTRKVFNPPRFASSPPGLGAASLPHCPGDGYLTFTVHGDWKPVFT